MKLSIFTLSKAQSLADGDWYWRVATVDAKKNIGIYSAVQQFYKEYIKLQLVTEKQDEVVGNLTNFEWMPIDGAAKYEIQLAKDPQFNGAISFRTDNIRFSPTIQLNDQEYFWRIRMIDYDNKAGPYIDGRVSPGSGNIIKLFIPIISKN